MMMIIVSWLNPNQAGVHLSAPINIVMLLPYMSSKQNLDVE